MGTDIRIAPQALAGIRAVPSTDGSWTLQLPSGRVVATVQDETDAEAIVAAVESARRTPAIQPNESAQLAVNALRAGAVAILAALGPVPEQPQSEPSGWYYACDYPYGAKAFRKHKKQGMVVDTVSKRHRVRREDAEKFWAELRKRPTRRPRREAPVSTTVELLAKAGIRLTKPIHESAVPPLQSSGTTAKKGEQR